MHPLTLTIDAISGLTKDAKIISTEEETQEQQQAKTSGKAHFTQRQLAEMRKVRKRELRQAVLEANPNAMNEELAKLSSIVNDLFSDTMEMESLVTLKDIQGPVASYATVGGGTINEKPS